MNFDMKDVRAIALAALKGLLVAVPLVAALALCGCESQKADAAQKRRYEVEYLDDNRFLPTVEVVTDTEKDQRWLVVCGSGGGVAIEPMDGSER